MKWCGLDFTFVIVTWTCLIIKGNAVEHEIKFYLDSEDNDVTPVKRDTESSNLGGVISTESGISFFVKKEDGFTGTVYGCPVNHTRPCVPKCCDLRQSFRNVQNRSQCTDSDEEFSPEFKDCPNYGDEIGSLPIEERFEYFIGNPCTKGKYVLDVERFPEDEHYLYSNGSLWYGNRIYSMADFCLESLNGTTRVFVCFEVPEKFKFQHVLYPIGLLVSIPFLLATAVVYVGIDMFRDLQGKALACHVTCLAIGYFFLALVQLASDELNEEVCMAAAFIIQFFFVACFFWLNVLCFDTWRNIHNDFRILIDSGSSKREKMKFIYYSFYAWYGPCMLSIVSLVMDLEPTIPESLLKPNFGVRSCWFNSDAAALPYFYGPVGILICINVIFFVLSARMIYREQRKNTKIIRNSVDSGETKKIPTKLKVAIKTLKQCVSLFCVMGINWLAEIISWAIGGSVSVWLVTDIFNTLQGLIIFYLFVIKQTVVKNEVKRRLTDFWGKIVGCGDANYRRNDKQRISNHWHAKIQSEDDEEEEEESVFDRRDSDYMKVSYGSALK